MATAPSQDSDLHPNGGAKLLHVPPPTILLPEAEEDLDNEDGAGECFMDLEDSDLPDRFKHFTLRKQTSYR